MKELQLIDRVVVEIKGEEGFSLTPDQLKNMLQFIAYKIADKGMKGENFTDQYNDGPEFEVLFERECTAYGFRMGNKSLIGMHYYGSEKKDEFPVLTLMREDLEQKGFDTSNLGDEWMEKIASKVGDILLDSDYWDHLVWAADYYKVPRYNNDSIRAHLDDILVDDETDTGGTSFHNQTLRELLEEIPTTLKEMNITLDDDVSVLDDILEECGIKPIVKDNNDVREVIPGALGMLNELSINQIKSL